MGNAAGTLGVVINEQNCTAGGQVSGTVYVMVNSEIEAEYLILSVSGEEYALVCWRETRGSGDNRKTVTRRRRYKRSLVQLETSLADFSTAGAKLAPGRYEFPFTLTLPYGLPSSMGSRGPHGSKCRISYAISARLGRPGYFTSDFRTARQFIVSAAPPPPMPTRVFVQPDTQQVNFCCCFNRGSMSLATTVDDTSIGRGETLGVGLACRNDSTSEILGVDVEVTEVVVWGPVNGGGRHNSSRRTLARITVDPAQVNGTGQLTPEQLEHRKSTGMDPHLANFAELFNRLSGMGGGTKTQFQLPADARDTYKGSVIKTMTTISLTLRTGSCITNPQLVVPLNVGSPKPQGVPVVSAQLLPTTLPTAQAVPIVLAEPLEPLEEESNSIQTKPPDWSGATIAPTVEVSTRKAVIGGVVEEGDGDEQPAAQAVAVHQLVEIVSLGGFRAEMDRSVDGA